MSKEKNKKETMKVVKDVKDVKAKHPLEDMPDDEIALIAKSLGLKSPDALRDMDPDLIDDAFSKHAKQFSVLVAQLEELNREVNAKFDESEEAIRKIGFWSFVSGLGVGVLGAAAVSFFTGADE